jgi:hypothetical protein
MNRRALIGQIGILLLVIGGCARKEPGLAEVEPGLRDESSVTFDLEPAEGGNGSQQWNASYVSGGKMARFRIELGPAEDHPAKTAQDFSVKTGEGKFVAVPDSDASLLLADLQKALQANALPKHVSRIASLRFTFAIFGDNCSRAPGGGFNRKPSGDWTAMKIFFGEGDQESEVFLNLNPKTRKGEFSMKDPDYGNLVLAQLAKVL